MDRPGIESQVAVSGYEGLNLHELLERYSDDLLGSIAPAPDGRFPLLVKYISTDLALSVQVHPDEERAAAIGGGAEPKTEAWYFLGVERDREAIAQEPSLGCVLAGLKPGVDGAELTDRASSSEVLELMNRWEVEPGQSMLVPGGTIHAIGAGVTLLEVQQNSDTTYRIWDWDRVEADGTPRSMHVEEALAAVRYDLPPHPPVDRVWTRLGDVAEQSPLTRSHAFGMNALRVRGRTHLSTEDQFQIYAVVEGSVTLEISATGESVDAQAGEVWLIPAASGHHDIDPLGDEATLVQILARP